MEASSQQIDRSGSIISNLREEMCMLRSMYSGISGMRGFQTKLDVIGNNIANVNTIGFKGSRVMFQDLMSQTIRGATGPTDTQGE